MLVRSADGSLATYRVQWQYCSDAAKPLKYPTAYGSSNYYDPQGYNISGPGEIVETGRKRNRKPGPRPKYQPNPCPDDAYAWAAYLGGGA